MGSPAETALTLVVISSAAIVGSLTTVFVLALFGAKRYFPVRAHRAGRRMAEQMI